MNFVIMAVSIFIYSIHQKRSFLLQKCLLFKSIKKSIANGMLMLLLFGEWIKKEMDLKWNETIKQPRKKIAMSGWFVHSLFAHCQRIGPKNMYTNKYRIYDIVIVIIISIFAASIRYSTQSHSCFYDERARETKRRRRRKIKREKNRYRATSQSAKRKEENIYCFILFFIDRIESAHTQKCQPNNKPNVSSAATAAVVEDWLGRKKKKLE